MRLMVMFDLPTISDIDKRAYMQFHKFLIKEGYSMLQYSIYVRICAHKDAALKYENHLINHVPRNGSIRTMILTEKQYQDMRIVLGSVTKKEDKIGKKGFIVFE